MSRWPRVFPLIGSSRHPQPPSSLSTTDRHTAGTLAWLAWIYAFFCCLFSSLLFLNCLRNSCFAWIYCVIGFYFLMLVDLFTHRFLYNFWNSRFCSGTNNREICLSNLIIHVFSQLICYLMYYLWLKRNFIKGINVSVVSIMSLIISAKYLT